MDTETLIIGGGLSGLALARQLHAAGRSFMLVEARDRFGGRVKAITINGASFDLGPAWFWPGQPRMAQLVANFGLNRFDQYSTGDLLYEDETAQVQRGRGYASMEGSWRIAGGFTAMIAALADSIPDQARRLGCQVTQLARLETGVSATCADATRITAQRVVLALPPRLAAEITFAPALPQTTINTLTAVPTWMAGQAKALAIYDTPFWREAGLSGDAMSRHGPMVEMHDASPKAAGPYAIFGFIGVPPQGRTDRAQLEQQTLAQLMRLFGPRARSPLSLTIKDWAQDHHTATHADQAPLYAHPRYGLPPSAQSDWDGQVVFSGTETAHQFGGYLEGALEAAEDAFHLITRQSDAA